MKKRTLWLLLGILIIATLLRTYQLTSLPPGLYPDEATNGTNALEALRTNDFKVFYPENNGREGLFMNIQAMSLALFGQNDPWVLRLPSAIFGVLTVLGLFFLSRELLRRIRGSGMDPDTAALLSAFFLAVSFWHINFSRIGFRAITSLFFLVWTLYFFLRALERKDSRFQILDSVLAGAFFGLGFYSYLSYRVMPLLLLLFIPFFFRERRFWKITGWFILATFIAAAPIGWYYATHPADFMGRTSQVSVFKSAEPLQDLGKNVVKTVGMLNFEGDGNWRHNVAGRPQLYWPVGILFWAGVVAALRSLFRGPERLTPLLLFGWTGLAMLPVVISNEGIPHALRAILMLPPLMIFAAWGAALVPALMKRSPQLLRRAVIVLFFAILIAEAWHTYFVVFGRDPNVPGAFAADYAEMARQIRSLPDAEPKYIVVEAGGVPVRIEDAWTGTGRDVPVPAQTVMFMTDSYAAENQRARNIHWLSPAERDTIPAGASVFVIK